MTNPYRPRTIVRIQENEPAPNPVAVTGVIQPKAEPEPAPEGTVADVLKWVGDDPLRARTAWIQEYNGSQRKTLISELSKILRAADQNGAKQ